MGLYDNVLFEMDCPKCQSKISGFQSKNGPCWLHDIDFRSVDTFYSCCNKCRLWIEYRYKVKPALERTIDDYELVMEDLPNDK